MGKKNNLLPNKYSETATRLFGALSSGKRAAYLALLIKLLKPLTSLIDKLISLFSKTNSKGNFPLAIMIVSPPRSGSTIVFQTLARVIPGLYFSNLHAMFPRHASSWVSSREGRIPFRKKNYYGYTANFYDVYEGNEFIDPLFSSSNKPKNIRNDFTHLMQFVKAVPGKTFIFKNVRNYKHIAKLSTAVPEVLFIRLKRSTTQVVQSEYRAYQELKTFHPVPDSLKESDITDPLEFTVHQILGIEKEIDRQKAQIDPDMWVEWEYEAFCEDPIGHIRDLAVNKLNIPESKLRPERLTYTLKASNSKKVSDEEAKRIRALINVINKD